MKNRQEIYSIAGIVLLIDQIIKLWIDKILNLYQEVKIIPNFFSILYLKNTGAAFSILENNTTLLIIISVIFILILDKYIKKETKPLTKLSKISLGMVIGGILGNLLDRIIYHAVIDYLAFQIKNYSFPVFNFADTAIVIGVLLLLLSMFKEEKNEKHSKCYLRRFNC